MERGELVPDEVVVAIIADRIGQPDASRGFVLDGFPRTVPQAEALDRLLAERGLKLDAVIALNVDEGILLQRIENRVKEMTARGEKLRADDNPEVLKGRLAAYRAQTAPLIDYYAAKGMLKNVDGMAPIAEVKAAIDRLLVPARAARTKPAARKARGRKAKAPKRHAAKGKTAPAKPAAGRRRPAGAKARKSGRKPSAARAKNKSGQRKLRHRRRLTKG
jgi:adenylate kinase